MQRAIIVVILSFFIFVSKGYALETHKFEVALCDAYLVSETGNWNVEVTNYVRHRLADVKISPKSGYDFNMKLLFKSDSEGFFTPHMIQRSVRHNTEVYLPYIVENKINLKPAPLPDGTGYYAVITDKKWAKAKKVPAGNYKYMTRGLYRTSPETVLEFSVMTNEVASDNYKSLLEYVFSFMKKATDQNVKSTRESCAEKKKKTDTH